MSIVNKVKSLSARVTMSEEDIRSLLAKDHQEAKALAKQMHEASSASRRMTLLNKFKPALTAHSRAEEKSAYDPLLRVRFGDDSHEIANEGYVEHSLLDELLTTLASTDAATERWQATAKVLQELLEHHIQEEESDTFALLGNNFSRDELETMGTQFARLKADFLRNPKPAKRRTTATAAKRRVPAKRARVARKVRAARSARKSASK